MATIQYPPASTVPDCFNDSDGSVDCFLQDHMSVDSFYFQDDPFLTEKTPLLLLDEPATSSNPSDVSSDGSGCIELLGSEAGDEGGSLTTTCFETSPTGRVASSGESVNNERPDESASCAKQQFVLVRLDDAGRYMRTANEDDMRLLVKLLNSSELAEASDVVCAASDDEEPLPASAPQPQTVAPVPSPSCAVGHRKPGGPCCHCGATESPQWRRGPANKPVLCNACGTRFRRTNQLGVAIPSYLKDKSRAAATAASKKRFNIKEVNDVVLDASPPSKQPRSGRHNASVRHPGMVSI